jgi:hypothetical protein
VLSDESSSHRAVRQVGTRGETKPRGVCGAARVIDTDGTLDAALRPLVGTLCTARRRCAVRH